MLPYSLHIKLSHRFAFEENSDVQLPLMLYFSLLFNNVSFAFFLGPHVATGLIYIYQ